MGFAGAYQKKKTKASVMSQTAASIKRSIEGNLAISAGTANIKSRDPIYHITESFKSTFDMCGQHNAEQLAGRNGFPAGSDKTGEQGNVREAPEETVFGSRKERRLGEPDRFFAGENTGESTRDKPGEKPGGKLGENPEYESTPNGRAEGDFYRKFSDVAFTNGHLAAAVLRDGGRTMFISCLKRTLGRSGPHNSLQSKLFSSSSVKAPVRNSLAKALFNRYTDSAVGLVVESIHSARQTLQYLESMAAEDSQKAVIGIKGDTLRKLYPFLNISEDTQRLTEYEKQLKELAGMEQVETDNSKRSDIAEQKAVLTAGITKTQGLITRKRQMKLQFFNQLTKLLENSQKAEAIFSRPGFSEEVLEELSDMEEPEDNDDDKNKGNSGESSGKPKK